MRAGRRRTGVPLLDGIGSTEMLHVFISNRLDDRKAGVDRASPCRATRPKWWTRRSTKSRAASVGRLAVRGPTGCRYLADARQKDYVANGWNVTGDAFVQDEDGYFHFAARNDDMIVSAGYNIAGPEVEAALLTHEAVLECAVIGAPDEERGQIVEAHVVLKEGATADAAMILRLQNHVKATIAPYKYPRSIKFAASLPKTQTGKIQRFQLKAGAEPG